MVDHSPARNPAANWYIGIGVVVALILGWFAMGQPGVPLHDGDYGCSAGSLSIGGGPGATVEGGEVVDVWGFDVSTRSKRSLTWSDAERKGPKKFTVTSEAPQVAGVSPGGSRSYECSYSAE